MRERSRDFLKPWEPIWPADDLTRGAFRRRLKRYAEDQRADQSYSFFIALKQEGVLVVHDGEDLDVVHDDELVEMLLDGGDLRAVGF